MHFQDFFQFTLCFTIRFTCRILQHKKMKTSILSEECENRPSQKRGQNLTFRPLAPLGPHHWALLRN